MKEFLMKARIISPMLALALLSTGAPAAEFSPDRIILSSGGLAEISATFPVAGRSTISFDAPLLQVDDILKSLVVTGAGVKVLSASLAGREPLSDTFSALPLKPADLENTLTLLTALKGVRVEVERIDRILRGVVIGTEFGGPVEEDTFHPAPGAARLLIMTEAGSVELIEVDAATRIRVLDERMRAAISDALDAIAANRSVDLRTIDVVIEAPGPAEATLTYVAGAPVWKPTWRVVLPATGEEGRFQGWAVLENRTGVDWEGVRLALSSGTPVAMRQTLHESVSIPRTEAPLQVGRRLRPDMDRGVVGAGTATVARRQRSRNSARGSPPRPTMLPWTPSQKRARRPQPQNPPRAALQAVRPLRPPSRWWPPLSRFQGRSIWRSAVP
jgi:hypothetical protein